MTGETTRTRTCSVCGGSSRPHVTQAGYRYWKCPDCSTSQIHPTPSDATLEEYYRSFHAEGGAYEDFEDRMQADFPLKARLARSLAPAPDARLLDVGCGKGFFVQQANAAGFKAEGIDLSTSAIEYATKALGLQAVAGRLQTDAPSRWTSAFDVATFWATIEHLPDPMEMLRAIHRCLKPGGLLLMDTGLGEAPFESWLAGHSQWYDAPQHLFVFSRKGLDIALRKTGFEAVAMDSNFERSLPRRWIKWLRHAGLCLGSYAILRIPLGRAGFRKMQEEAKWPIGRLLGVQARKTVEAGR